MKIVKRIAEIVIITSFTLTYFAQAGEVCLEQDRPISLQIAFKAQTNVMGMSIEGHSNKDIKVLLNPGKKVEVPLEALKTGMDLRDEHMRNEIFSHKNPIITLHKVNCKSLEVELFINEVSRRISIDFSPEEAKFLGKTNISLKSFKIKAPKKFGVGVEDSVAVSLTLVK